MQAPPTLPEQPGAYQLALWVTRPMTIVVGRLGRQYFPAGWYVYTGSAMKGLRLRLQRYLLPARATHWHIDYLRVFAELRAIALFPSTERIECLLNTYLMEHVQAQVVVRGFGSSDCHCHSHLLRVDFELYHAHLRYLLSKHPGSEYLQVQFAEADSLENP